MLSVFQCFFLWHQKHKKKDFVIKTDSKVPAARVLSSPSGGAAEDNVEERENSEVTQFFVTCYVLRTDVRTDVRTDGRMDRETWKLKYYFRL